MDEEEFQRELEELLRKTEELERRLEEALGDHEIDGESEDE